MRRRRRKGKKEKKQYRIYQELKQSENEKQVTVDEVKENLEAENVYRLPVGIVL